MEEKSLNHSLVNNSTISQQQSVQSSNQNSFSVSAGTVLFEGQLQPKTPSPKNGSPSNSVSPPAIAEDGEEEKEEKKVKKKKTKKIIKKVKKVKKPKNQDQVTNENEQEHQSISSANQNASNNLESIKYQLISFISRTGGSPSLPHYSYFEKIDEDNWIIFDDGNYTICPTQEIARAKLMAVFYMLDRML